MCHIIIIFRSGQFFRHLLQDFYYDSDFNASTLTHDQILAGASQCLSRGVEPNIGGGRRRRGGSRLYILNYSNYIDIIGVEISIIITF